MKKVILLAAFGVAGFINAKTSEVKVLENKTEVSDVKPFQLCGVSVTYYDGDGNVSGYDMITSDQSSLQNCQMWQSLVIHRLQKAGFSVSMN
ncbi:hypothetical protein ODZ84_20390 [Chryseobacterium fluminis]|uniref:hypothetical protein n=1 Tax=Chryseobacterium fluminis TaxID=2983606 RepID=UPI00224E6AB5|nr:hypothetical protein [Chryseobacterium sp. MMS21-Ot14]UZT97510.1 hypothetical protein ODZ84_20390 [Chryseobacterium sp. MMS21-Ot14]